MGDYELHDLVLLFNMSFGVIIREESEAFRVLEGVPDTPEVVLVKTREIKSKLEKRTHAQDKRKNIVSVRDIVRVHEGPCKGKQGPVQHIHRGILFIYDRHHLEHAGFICVYAQSCIVVGGNNDKRGGDKLDASSSLRPSYPYLQSSGRPPRGPIDRGGRHDRRGGRGDDALVGRTINIRSGPYKGYHGRVVMVIGSVVRIELDSQMKIVEVKRDDISETPGSETPFREPSRYGFGSKTPMHPSRTLHPYQTPMRDAGATPIHEGMRTPMRNRAWAPMSPPRDHWDDANPASWVGTPQYQPGTPARSYEAPTPGSGWANTPGGNYNDARTPGESSPTYGMQPMTPNSANYLPGTPGGQPMTPGNIGLDILSPVMGGDNEGNGLFPDVLVNVMRPGEGPCIAVVIDLLMDGCCKLALGTTGDGEGISSQPTQQM